MANEEMELFDVETVIIPLADGSEMECAILDEFELDGVNYMAIAPIEEDDTIGDDTYFYRFKEDGDDFIMDYIDDMEELKKVAAAYDQLLEEDE